MKIENTVVPGAFVVAVWVVRSGVVRPHQAGEMAPGIGSSVLSSPGRDRGRGIYSGGTGTLFLGLVFNISSGWAWLCRCPRGYQVGTEVKRTRSGSYRWRKKLGEGGGGVWRAGIACWQGLRLKPRPRRRRWACRSGEGSSPPIRAQDQGIAAPLTATVNLEFGTDADGALLFMELLDGLDADSLLRRFGPIRPNGPYLLARAVTAVRGQHAVVMRHQPAEHFIAGTARSTTSEGDGFRNCRAVRDAEGPRGAHAGKASGGRRLHARDRRWARIDGRGKLSTGCAYWFLTGQFVFTAETPMGLLLQHAQTPPTPPSARTDLPIPPALDDLVLSCLAKDPANRPQSARELSLRLAEMEGASAWTQDRAREWWTTHQPAPP